MARVIRPYDLLLDASAGWRASASTETAATSVAAGPIQLQTQASLLPALNDRNGTFGGHTLALGVATWQDEIFIADPRNHVILRWRLCCGAARPIATIGGRGDGPRQLDTPLGLTINRRSDLVVVDAGNRRLLLYTLPGLALRRIIGPFAGALPLPAREPFTDPCALPVAPAEPQLTWQPVDVAAGPYGHLFVADGGGRIWRLDTQGRPDSRYAGLLPDGFVPRRLQVDGQGRAYVIGDASGDPIVILDRYGVVMPQPEQLNAAVDTWLQLHLPVLAALPSMEQESEARAAVLPAELSRMIDIDLNRYLAARQRAQPELSKAAIWANERDTAYEVDPPGVIPQAYAAHLPAFLHSVLPRGRLSLLGNDLYQRMIAWLDTQGRDEGVSMPEQLRSAYNALVATHTPTASVRSGHVLLQPDNPCPRPALFSDIEVDSAGMLDQLYVLHRPPAATYEQNGLFRSEPLDSGRVANPWHRLVLELTIPDRTAVRLFSFTSDVLRPDLGASGLLAEPPQIGNWQAAVDNVDEWLIQSPPGRYLYLALVLKGPGDRTPTIERIYVYAHRQSSLRYLPAVYQEDATSRDLLDRLLSLFDTIYGEIESRIEEFPRYLDLAGAPPDFLPWLASWFDLTLEQSWTETQQRAFLQHIVELYAWRGTIRGMKRLLQLHTGLADPLPHIIEHFRTPPNPTDAPIEPQAAALNRWLGAVPDSAGHFTVLLPARHMDSPEKRGVLRRLIDANKPAHTHYTLRPAHGGVWLGSQSGRASAIGLDTTLRSPAPWRLPAEDAEPQAVPALNMLLAGTAPARLGRARLGSAQLRGRRQPE
ncbi:MAG: hypothetical protein HC822_21425 [Oscillochloris sp.]|nr:hypothetical protein [Oscillochloris sp.]